MASRWIPKTVRGRLMVLLGLVVIATSSTVALLGIAVASNAARGGFEATAQAQARQVVMFLRVKIAAASQGDLARAIDELVTGPNITGLAAFDVSGSLRAETWRAGRAPDPQLVAPLIHLALQGPNPVTRDVPRGYWVAVSTVNRPVVSDPADPASLFMAPQDPDAPTLSGAVLLEFSTAPLQAVERRIQLLTVSVTLLLSILLALAGLNLGNRIGRPILDLARQVSRGPLGPQDLDPRPSEPEELAILRSAIGQAQGDSELHLRALEDSERRARAVFDSAQDGMAIVAPGGVIVNANPALRKQLGPADDGERELPRLSSVFGPPEAVDAALAEALDTGSAELPNVTQTNRLGEVNQGELILSRLGIPGAPLTLVVFRDHSERLREEERRRYLEEQLRHSQKLEALGVMAGGIAHDFNNQLNIILGNLVLLWQDLGSRHPSQPLLEDLELATRRCIELTQGLLTFTRRERAKIRPFALRGLIEETLRLLKRTLPSTIQIEWSCSDDALNVMGEPSQIQQVFMNLCINAADAMPDGGTLRVSCGERLIEDDEARSHSGSSPGRYVELQVEDTGTGMDATTLAKAFDPFFTTKAPGRGTGLGLSTAFGIVRSHGGWIEAASRLGAGTELRVLLPVTPLPTRDEVSPARVVRGGTETVLVAEDDPRLLDLTCAMLGRHGYEVLPARDGDEALALYRAHGDSVRLLLLDLVMPNMGGGAVLRRLRSDGDPVPVILTTGYETSQELAHLLAEHAALFLAKPYSPEVLADRVREALDGSSPDPDCEPGQTPSGPF